MKLTDCDYNCVKELQPLIIKSLNRLSHLDFVQGHQLGQFTAHLNAFVEYSRFPDLHALLTDAYTIIVVQTTKNNAFTVAIIQPQFK